MKIKCIKIYNEISGKEKIEDPWMVVGKEYTPIEVICLSGKPNFRIISDLDPFETPALYNSDQFLTTSTLIPSNWKIQSDEHGGITIAPQKWLRPGFWEDYFNQDPQAIKEFEEEKNIIYKECS
jgi:hypothetical protein